MNNLLTGVYSILSASTLSTYVGGRIYAESAPDNADYPYVVYFIVSGYQDDDFKAESDDYILQFSLYSSSASMTEITTMYEHLKTAMDDASITITGDTCVWCYRQNLTTMIENVKLDEDNDKLKHWAVDYSIHVQD